LSVSGDEIHDSRLSRHGNRLLKSIELLLVQQNIFSGLIRQHMTQALSEMERNILEGRIKKLRKGAVVIQSIISLATDNMLDISLKTRTSSYR